jgi:inhibitor of cysteine peptidase
MKPSVSVLAILILCIAFLCACGCTQPATTPATPTATSTPAATTVATTAATTAAPNATTTAAPETTAVPPATEEKVYTESADGSTITVPLNGTFMVKLLENPTTGYTWDVSVTPGLTIVNDTYIAPVTTLVGAGGSHVWDVKAIKTGQQKFSGVYKHSWENTTANDTTFALMVNVT